MKTIIVLAFFGILGCTFCQRVRTGPEGCRDVYEQADPNLKNEQFFTGSWYLTHAKYKNYTSLCTKFDLTSDPLQIKYEVNTVKVTCNGEKVPGARHTEYKCKGDGKGGSKTPFADYEEIVSVIDTDYTNYATVYVCKKTSGNEDNVFVLSRTQAGEPPEAAKTSLQKLGENLSNFQKFTCIQLLTITVP